MAVLDKETHLPGKSEGLAQGTAVAVAAPAQRQRKDSAG